MNLWSRFVLLFALLTAPAAAQTIPAGAWGSINYWGVGGLSQVLAPGLAGQCLQTQGVGSAPIWTTCFTIPPQNANTILANVTTNFVAPQAVDINRVLDTVGYDISRPPAPESILYKSNVGPTFNWQTLPPGSSGAVLTSGGATNPPFWAIPGALNGVTNAQLATMPANTVKCNQGATATPQDCAYNFFSPTGTFSDFVHDDGVAINAALTAAANAGGGWVLLNPSQPYWASSQITVPQNVALGCVAPPQKQLTNPNYVSVGCSVYLAPNNTIINTGAILNAHIIQDNIHFAGNPATAHALAAITANYPTTGTGIKMNAADTIVEDVAMIGFNLDIEDNSLNRGSIRHVLLEGTNCIKYDQVGDYSKGIDIECWPFYSTNRGGGVTSYTTAISNVADNGSGAWRITLSGAPSEALVTGDTIFIGGSGALTIPQGALGIHTITVIDSTHFDLTGSHSAPAVSGTTTSGSPYVTGLATLADLWVGETFTGSCFTGTRTVKFIGQNLELIADANATSSGACTLTFASQAFSATGTPQVIFSARTDWNGVGIEFSGGSVSGGIFNNIFVWGHQVAFQFDANTLTATLDTVSTDFTASAYYSKRIGFWFKSGSLWNRITGNSQTSGGTAVWNQNGFSSLSQANMVKLGRVGGWTWGAIENDSGALIVSGTIDPDNSAAAGQFNADIFNVTGQPLAITDGSAFVSAALYNSTAGANFQTGTSGIATDTSYVGTQRFLYPPGTVLLGSGGGNSGSIQLNGSTSGSATVNASAAGQLQLANNTAGQSVVVNDAGNGTMFAMQNGVFWPKVLTIATLPTCNGPITGARATVSNGSAPTYLGTVSATGAVTVGVFCNGSSWLYD